MIDVTPPPAPTSNPEKIVVDEGNEALVVHWPLLDASLYPDLRGYQILCNRGGELQVFKEGSFDPFYQSCPNNVAAGGGGVNALDPLFVCSPVLSPSTSSHRIKILQNDIYYSVAVVAVDESGNASQPYINYGKPGAQPSFYDRYRVPKADEPGPPGSAEGGFCALAPAESSHRATWGTTTGLAFTSLGLVLRARRRRARDRGTR